MNSGDTQKDELTGQSGNPYRPDRVVWGIVAVYMILAVTYSYVMLLGQAADETNRHYAYVRWLAETWQLPIDDPEVTHGNLELHPPLYYFLLTPVYLLAHSGGDAVAMRALRWTSPFIVLVGLLLWMQVIWRACGGRRRPFLLAFALTAWWPNLFVEASAITNDAGALTASALLLYLIAVRWWDDRSLRSTSIYGVIAGLAALMKASTIPTSIVLIAVALVWQHGKRFYSKRDFWVRAGVAAAAFVVVCGWWYWRNIQMYGALTPFAVGYRGIPEGISNWQAISYGLAGPLALRAVNGLWASVFAGMVWFPDSTHMVIYTILRIITIAGIVGVIVGIIRMRAGEAKMAHGQAQALILASVGFATLWLASIWMATFVHMGWYQGGRYLLLALPGLTIPLALGLDQLFQRMRSSVPYGLILTFFIVLSPIAWYHIATFWNPQVQRAIEDALTK